MAEQRLSQLADRLEKVASRLESASGKQGGGASVGGANENTEIVEGFDTIVLGGQIKEYFKLSEKIGGDVQKQALLVKEAFNAQREIIVLASKHIAPKQNVFADSLKPITSKINSIQAVRQKVSRDRMNHIMTVNEGIGCLGWVTVAPKPAPYVKEMFDQSLFYGNRVLKEFKGKDDSHVDWMRAFTKSIKDLEEYIRTYHLTGITWNPEGTPFTTASSAPPPPGASGPPPPPPPAVLPPSAAPPTKPAGAAPDTDALFSALNKGSAITSGLKKVTNDMKTYKNPELRASSVVKADDIKKGKAKATPKAAAPVAKKPPVFELKGQKWIVENQENNNALEINIDDPKQAVFIYKCNKSTIKVSNKCNSIFIDSCKRVALVFEGVISAVDIVNSQSIQVQCMGQCHTVSIDKTDGCQVYLSKECLNVEIITAKSSEMNIMVPNDEGEFSENAVPEQFRTSWNGKRLVTNCTDING